MNPKFFWLITAILLAHIHWAEAQQTAKVPRIGVLDSGSAADPENTETRNAFLGGLRDLGYVEGKNIIIDFRYDEGRSERLGEVAEEFVHLKVDVLLGMDTFSALAAKRSTSTIPIVFTTGANPTTTGLVASLSRPAGNATGVTTNSPELVGKRLEMLKETLPSVSRFGFMSDAGSTSITVMFNEAQPTAKALGIQFLFIGVKRSNPDIEGAFRRMTNERIGAFVTEGPPTIAFHRNEILKLAVKYHLPAIHSAQRWASDGGLMSYGANRTDPYCRVTVYVDKILKGAKPADLPVEQPTKFELVINLKTAKQMGLIIPPNVLARADRVIK